MIQVLLLAAALGTASSSVCSQRSRLKTPDQVEQEVTTRRFRDNITNAQDYVTNAVYHQFFGASTDLGGQVLVRVPSFGIDVAALSEERHLIQTGDCTVVDMTKCPTLRALDYYVGVMWTVPSDYESSHTNINPNKTETFTVSSQSEDHKYQTADNGQPKGNLLNMYDALLHSSISITAPRTLTVAEIKELEAACKHLTVHKGTTGDYNSPDWLCTTTRPSKFQVSYDHAFDAAQTAYNTYFDRPTTLNKKYYENKYNEFVTMDDEYRGYVGTISALTAQTFGRVLLENMKDDFSTKMDQMQTENAGLSFEFVTDPAHLAYTRITHDKLVDISDKYNFMAEGKVGITARQPAFMWEVKASGDGGSSFSNSTHTLNKVEIDGSYAILEIVHPYVDNTLFTMDKLRIDSLFTDDVNAPTIQDAALISDLLRLPSYVTGLLISKDVSIRVEEDIEQVIKSDTHYSTSTGFSLFGHQLWGSSFESKTTSESDRTEYTKDSVITKGESIIGILITVPSTGSTTIGFPKLPVDSGSSNSNKAILEAERTKRDQQGSIMYEYKYDNGQRRTRLPKTTEKSQGQ